MTPTVRDDEVEFTATRAQGPGGQNVNKVSSAVQLRFDIRASALPPRVKERLLALPDQRITREGVVVIKAQSSRSRAQNKAAAMARLQELVAQAAHERAVRRATQPTFASRQRRLQSKAQRAEVKAARARRGDEG